MRGKKHSPKAHGTKSPGVEKHNELTGQSEQITPKKSGHDYVSEDAREIARKQDQSFGANRQQGADSH